MPVIGSPGGNVGGGPIQPLGLPFAYQNTSPPRIITQRRPQMASLTDDFTTADTAKWSYGAAAAVTSGQLILTPNTSYTGFVQSLLAYDLTGSEFVVELPQATNVGNGGVETYIALFVDNPNSNAVLFDILGGVIKLYRRTGGTTIEAATAPTYDATAHRWLRFREAGGTVFWDTSPDRTTWTNQASTTPSWPLTSLFVVLGNGYGGTEPSPGLSILDNVNLAAAASTPAAATGAITLGGSGTGAGSAGATGSLTLTGAGSAQVAAGSAGSLTLTGTGAATAPATAAGALTLAGSGTARAASAGTGTLTLAGSATAQTTATATGAITLGGTATAATTATATGTISLGGSPSAAGTAAGTGAVTLGGATSAAARPAATGTITLSGTGTGTIPGVNTATGSVTLGGTATARAVAASSGSVSLTGSGTAAATVATTGTLTLAGAATARVPATAQGLIFLSGLANSTAVGAPRDITLHVGGFATRGLTGAVRARALTGTATARRLQADTDSGAVTATVKTRRLDAELV